MTTTLSLAAGATLLLAAALLLDRVLAGRWPLVTAALWNAMLAGLVALVPAVCLLPRWELPVLPADAPPPVVANGAAAPATVDAPSAHAPAAIDRPAFEPAAIEPPIDSRPTTAAVPAVPSSEPGAAAPRRWHFKAWHALAVVYGLGVAAALVRLGANWLAAARLRRTSVSVESGPWRARCNQWVHRLGVHPPVDLLTSPHVSIPMVAGWRRPALIVPQAMLTRDDARTLDAVLVHELAHVERSDCAWQLVERFVGAGLWFHPLFRLARGRMGLARERACDDLAIYWLADRAAYAESLLDVAAHLVERRSLGLAMTVVRSGHLERRLESISRSPGSRRALPALPSRVALLAVALLAATAASTARPVPAAAEPAAPTKDAPSPAAAPSEQTAADAHRNSPEERAARAFRSAVRGGKYDEAAALLTPELQAVLPAARLKALFDDLADRHGTLMPGPDWDRQERFGNTQLHCDDLSWERGGSGAALVMRMAIDRDGRVSGLWLAPRRNGPPPQGFEEANYRFGNLIENLAAIDLSLSARVTDTAGRRVKKAILLFYRELAADEPAEQQSDCRDPDTGRRCAPFVTRVFEPVHRRAPAAGHVSHHGLPECRRCRVRSQRSDRARRARTSPDGRSAAQANRSARGQHGRLRSRGTDRSRKRAPRCRRRLRRIVRRQL